MLQGLVSFEISPSACESKRNLCIKSIDILNPHPTLKQIVEWATERYPELRVITSGYRPGDTSCHGTTPLRAVDFRCKDYDRGKVLEAAINKKWQYDHERPQKKVTVYHESKKGARDWHLHLQVHPNTRLRGWL